MSFAITLLPKSGESLEAEVCAVFREAMAVGMHSDTCPASKLEKHKRFACDCWISRATEMVKLLEDGEQQ